MGKGSSLINNINDTIANNILNSIQNTQKISKLTQSISGKCESSVVQTLINQYNDCILNFIDIPAAGDLSELCSPFANLCSMTDISLSASVNVQDDSLTVANVTQQATINIKNGLKQYSRGDGTDMLINNINNQSLENVANILQNIKNSSLLTQKVNLLNYQAQFISFKNVTDIINQTLQNDTELQTSIANVSNVITQTNDNESSNLMIFFIIISIILIVWIIIKLIMMMSRSKDYQDFFKRLAPYIGFIVVSSLIVGIHLVAKPSYIMYTNVDGKKYINKRNFVLIMSIAILIVGIICLVVNKIINKNV